MVIMSHLYMHQTIKLQALINTTFNCELYLDKFEEKSFK